MGIFGRWGRNARVLVATEPFWSIPMSWVFFYRSIFLSRAVGLSEVEIGLLATAYASMSALLPMAGGYLADRFGRKRVFMFFDGLGWMASLTIWAVTRNIWYALAAYLFEGIVAVIFPVWECLLVEDTAPEYRAGIYGYVSTIYNIGALSTPVAGYLISLYGVDAGCRMIFVLALACMIPMYAIRQAYLRETELGYRIMSERELTGVKGYRMVFTVLRRSTVLAALLAVSVLGTFYYTTVSLYLPLYLVDSRGLGLTEASTSLVPSVMAASSLAVTLLVVPRLRSREDYVKALTLGYGLGFLAILLLAHLPESRLILVLIPTTLLGVYYATGFSVSRTFMTNEIETVDGRFRAKILSITTTVSSLINLPTPAIVGYLYSMDPKLFLTAVSAVLGLSMALLLYIRRR